jgi:hypothetical protein
VARGIGGVGLIKRQATVVIMTSAMTTPISFHGGEGGIGTTFARLKSTDVPLSTMVPAAGT